MHSALHQCLSTLVMAADPPEDLPDTGCLPAPDESQDALQAWWPVLQKAHTLVLNEKGVARAVALWEDYERESAHEIHVGVRGHVDKFMRIVWAAKREGQGVILLAWGAKQWVSEDEHVAMES
jgi:hypothetical protein